MAFYESVWIARQDISTSQVESLTEQFSAIIQAGGGEVKSHEYWGLRSLAYKINKNRKAHYVLFNLDAPASAVAEMERNMRLNEDVMRCLTVRVEELIEGQSVMLQQRAERSDRPERGGDRGGDRGGFRGGDRGGERGGERSDRGGDRGGYRGERSSFRDDTVAVASEGDAE
ncbi:MAG: 30S ribosomal protein S6 [Alphaproteobacteria bacterium]|nr:30S ribosomal protein S6 [Alphaproteobacteria bacterium]MBU0795600.1 30S ribosomal protein S6 [Alphaproteobacteria bacterium]MBU0887657.1 30S ribosomal protein S6 [Alphaproteobacteria bacterium]MBU1812916.1 30S ribosomal protein S6 [Alphaproteobacteria bacterium]